MSRSHHVLVAPLERRSLPQKGGWGLFAVEPVPANSLLLMWGGDILTGSALDAYPEAIRTHSLQVDWDLYIVPTSGLTDADYVNHSCDPSAGMRGQIALVARRDLEAGAEITFDYAMTDSSDYDEFVCACGSPRCRGRVRGDDWKRPELQTRYAGWFSPYLEVAIQRG